MLQAILTTASSTSVIVPGDSWLKVAGIVAISIAFLSLASFMYFCAVDPDEHPRIQLPQKKRQVAAFTAIASIIVFLLLFFTFVIQLLASSDSKTEANIAVILQEKYSLILDEPSVHSGGIVRENIVGTINGEKTVITLRLSEDGNDLTAYKLGEEVQLTAKAK